MDDVQLLQPIVLQLSSDAHRCANQLILRRNIQNTKYKTLLKALSVWAVNKYLNQLKINTDLDEYIIYNAASLFISKIGFIECLPLWKVNKNTTELDVKHLIDRPYIAYLMVELSDALDLASILGYIPVNSTCIETIDRTKLQSISNFPSYLKKIEDSEELEYKLTFSGFLEDENFSDFFGKLGTQLIEQYIPEFLFIAESLIIYRENIPTKEKEIRFKKLLLGKTPELLSRDIVIRELHRVRPGNKMISSRQRVPWLAKQWIDILDRLKI